MCVNSEQASPFSLATDPCYRLLPAAVAGGEREDFASRGLLLAASGERDNDTHGPPSSHRVCGASAVASRVFVCTSLASVTAAKPFHYLASPVRGSVCARKCVCVVCVLRQEPCGPREPDTSLCCTQHTSAE